MEWQSFLEKTQNTPIIRTDDLLAGGNDPIAIAVMLTRWVKSKKLMRLKRGVYLLASCYRQVEPYLPFVAGSLISPSYISLHKALEFYDLIPEGVPRYTSLTTKRPSRFETPLGTFQYRHIHPKLFWGYRSVADSGHKQTGFMATPEKALLDHFYFWRGRIDQPYMQEMRLQNLAIINPDVLMEMAQRFNKPKVLRAARMVLRFREQQHKEETTL